MPIAAVPLYLQGQDPEFYLSAPLGHRFSLYFPVWGENGETGDIDWRTKDRVKEYKEQRGVQEFKGWTDLENDTFAATVSVGKTAPHLPLKRRARQPKTDEGLKPWKPMMQALAQRQGAIAQNTAHLLAMDAVATAPFTTGLGNEHPLENGFAFLNPYGLPYLPGSGIKGVVRQAARELASGDWGDKHGWTEEKIHQLTTGNTRIDLSVLDVLFGLKSTDGEKNHVRGALSFWDALPQIPGDSLAVDIMTPHQSHYYQWKRDRDNNPIPVSPHDSGQLKPISFLTLPPGTRFAFHVQCDLPHLQRLAPHLAHEGRWQTLLTAAFQHAFEWLGFGAKTAVGYGAMQVDQTALKRRENEAAELQAKTQREEAQRQRLVELETMSPIDRAISECLDARKDKNMADIPALKNAIKTGQWQGDMQRDVALRLRDMMQAAKKWKESTQAKKPEKDGDYQDTLLVKAWIEGK